MKSTDVSTNTKSGEDRQKFESTPPSAGGITNVSQQDNGKVLMNKPELDERGSRADALLEIMNMDTERLGTEAPRHTKIPG
jgi:hypothetical protein